MVKGLRNQEVVESMIKNKAVYFGAIGGAAALNGKCVKKSEIVTYEDLGAEAIRRLEVEDLPIVVVIDCEGNNLYEQGQNAYLKVKNKFKENSKDNSMVILTLGLSIISSRR